MAKKLEKKAKVEPVQGSKVKKQKMALAKQLKSMSIGTSGAANTGGGGGGGGYDAGSTKIGGNGGSGVVIIRYPV